MKIICHIDLNAFFAQVEMNRHPEHRNKPLIVGGGVGRGVVATANYEARKFGIHSGMPVGEAHRLCRQLVDVPGDYREYERQSERFFSVVRKTFPLMEMASIDECYVDGTKILGSMDEDEIHDYMWDFQMSLVNMTELKCSIGIGKNKFVAKMGSDYRKPLGLTLLLEEEKIREKLWPLRISSMFGVGAKTAPRLESAGIETIGDLAMAGSNEDVKKILGSSFEWFIFAANGGGSDVLDLEEDDPKSASCDTTFLTDTSDYEEIRNQLTECAKSVGRHIRSHGKVTRTVAIKLRNDRFETRSRRIMLDSYVDDDESIAFAVMKLFDEFYNDEPLRLVGCSVEGCIDKGSDVKPIALMHQMTIDEASIGGDGNDED